MVDERDVRCADCGARMSAEAEWCPQCLKRIEPAATFAPPDAFLGPARPAAYSRTVKTSVTYGPAGRVVATVLLVVMPTGYLLTYAFPFAIIYLVAAVPLLLGSIWRKTPVPPE
jgi:hypothetical protein